MSDRGPSASRRAREHFEAYRRELLREDQAWTRRGARRGSGEAEVAHTRLEYSPPDVDPDTHAGKMVLATYERQYEFGPAGVPESERRQLADEIERLTREYGGSSPHGVARELADLYFRMRNFDRALYFSKRAIEENPQDAEVHLLRNDIFRTFAMGKKLQESWRVLLRLDPDNPDYRRGQAEDQRTYGEFNGLRVDRPVRGTVDFRDQEG